MNIVKQRIQLLLLHVQTRFHHDQPTPISFPLNLNHPILSKLQTCRTLAQFNQILAQITTAGIFHDVFAASRLLKAAATSSPTPLLDLQSTTLLFSQIQHPDVFCYNLMIKAHDRECPIGTPLKSIRFYQYLLGESQKLRPNEYTFCFLLDCCSSSSTTHGQEGLLVGRQIHTHLLKHGFGCGLFVGTSLVDMYGKCGVFEDALRSFDEIPQRTEVSWGAIIGACVSHGYLNECFRLFKEMMNLGNQPNNATLVGMLCALGKVDGLVSGRAIHGFVLIRGLQLTVTLGTSLVHMYAKCGDVSMARQVFTTMPVKSVASWNCMINGLAINGCGLAAICLFKEMLVSRELPNSSTLMAVLSACNHAGLVEDGVEYFLLMKRNYGIMPNLKHYGSIVNLYGRAGRIENAVEFISAMKVRPDAVIWVALLGACKFHGHILLAEVVGAQLLKLLQYDLCLSLLLSDNFSQSVKALE